jgi:hypothetical protein
MPRRCKPASPFRCFNSSPEVIRLAVLTYVKYPLSLRNVEASTFATRRCGSDGTGSARCLQVTFVGSGQTGCVASASGNGTSTRCM